MTKIINSRRELFELINRGDIKIKFGLGTILLALGGTFVDAYDFGSIGIGVIQLTRVFHLTAFLVGTLTSAMAFGALIGALYGGRLIDRIGRYEMFLIDLILFVIGAIGAALSINFPMLLLFRFLIGLGVGIDFPAALSLIAEYSSLKSRGRNVNLWQAMWYIATVIIYTIGFLMYLNYSYFGLNIWRWVIGLGAVPAAIIIVLRFKYMKESPLWLFARGSSRDIENFLRSIGYNDIIVNQNLENVMSFGEFKKLFKKEYRKRTLLSTTISVEESLQYFAVGFYLPVILDAIFAGNAVLAVLGTALVNISGIIGGTWQSLLTQKIGVRRLTIIGLIPCFIILLVLGFIGKYLPVIVTAVLLSLFIFFHSSGPGAQGMTMATLSFPPNIRGVGTGFVQGMLRIGSILGFYLLPLLKSYVGLYNALLYLSIAPLISLIVVLLIKWDPIFAGVSVDQETFE
ncbi:MFS transporter [Sulfurisphaera ohwakuensis]|uniref:MFS transporter n=1 Tax=Sulfurisphaera ohwakuensis TaxID=69656 RepID=UPI0036F3FD0F